MMDSEKRNWFFKIAGGFLAIVLGLYCCADDGEEKRANRAAISYSRLVNADINEANKCIEKAVETRYEYRVGEFLEQLKGIRRLLEENRQKSLAIYNELDSKNDAPQPQYVLEDCKQLKQQLKELNKRNEAIRNEGEQLYEGMIHEWQKHVGEPNEVSENLKKAEEICSKFSEYQQEAEKRRRGCKSSWDARGTYSRLLKRMKIKGNQTLARLTNRKKALEQSNGLREQIFSQVQENGKLKWVLDNNKSKMKEINIELGFIRQFNGIDENLELPSLKQEALLVTPPEFKPDLVLTSSGDMNEEVLKPLVECWLTEHKATPLKGSRFIWDIRQGQQELEVKVPTDLQGDESGKLRIRIVRVKDANAAFDAVGRHGNVHLMLTGVLPSGKHDAERKRAVYESQELERAYKARICYDALVFFKGNALEINKPLRASTLNKQAVVFSINDESRREAANVLGVFPTEKDVEEIINHSTQELCHKYSNKIILGVWHKDVGRALSLRKKSSVVSYVTGWENEGALKYVPKEYLPQIQGIEPTEENIATGRYAYSYSIYGYRSIREPNSRASQLARKLLLFMADAENEKVAQCVRDAGYVPTIFDMEHMNSINELTCDDLPISVLLKAMGADAEKFGYDVNESEWVYGVRIPFAMYFQTGSAKEDNDYVYLDADAEYYTSTQAFARIKKLIKNNRALVVSLGHADVQHGGKLITNSNSWNSNLILSQKRAGFVKDVLKKKIPETPLIRHIAIGSGWARPACDISLSKSIELQQNELARCRRAEVFIIFPVMNKVQ